MSFFWMDKKRGIEDVERTFSAKNSANKIAGFIFSSWAVEIQ